MPDLPVGSVGEVRGDGNQAEVNVLVLDDEEPILASIKSLFRRLPYNFRFFTSPNIAMQFLRTSDVDVVVSDLRMVDTNGLEFMKEVVRRTPLAARVLMSGFEDKSIVMIALSTGLINHFLYKPWEDDEFRELITKCANSSLAAKQQKHENILYEFEDIPSPPRFQERLHEMLASLDVPMSKVVEEIEMNPALVARLLRVANSVYVGVRKRITSVMEAVLFVGMEYIASMIAALEAFNAYCLRVPDRYSALIENMSISAVRRGVIAKEIAARWEGLDNKYIPYVSSLLQDIGLFARVSLRPDSYDAFLKVKNELQLSSREAETKIFGNNSHEKIGAAILDRWNFPPDIVKTVRSHHLSPSPDDYTKIAQLAMLLEGHNDDFPHDENLEKILPEWRSKLRLERDEDSPDQGGRI